MKKLNDGKSKQSAWKTQIVGNQSYQMSYQPLGHSVSDTSSTGITNGVFSLPEANMAVPPRDNIAVAKGVLW